MTSFLVVSALASEAAYIPEGVPVVITGIGKTTAAVETTRALLQYGDTTDLVVLNVGTAGALRDGLTGLFRPGTVVNHDISADAIRALGVDPQEVLELDNGDGTVLASGDVFVTDPLVRDVLAERADLVDMEAYGVVLACQRLGVPVELVKHVSDNADEGAFDWPSVVDASARVLGAWVGERLGSVL
ncbi:adenosylhomocysteine nucleosidase [Marmoricola sp. OAE513]|uniref:nucleosidase n=1 Tax=Marmoricola sp. OAE513 TaxID=2817894 RepID=UPI001AEA085C